MTTYFRQAVVLAVALLGSPGADAHAQERSGPPSPPEVVASASAERSVPADLATVTLRFSRLGATPAEAGRNVALLADSVRRALGALGIPRDSMLTGSRWSWWRSRIEVAPQVRRIDRAANTQEVDTMYRVNEAIQVRIRNLANVGKVIDVALAQGITDISEIQFFATDTERAQLEAIREATQKARARAEAIAAASGAQLGRTHSLSTVADRYGYDPSMNIARSAMTMGVSAGGGGGETVIVEPILRVIATVTGRWELLEQR